jgi:hypothetical protein
MKTVVRFAYVATTLMRNQPDYLQPGIDAFSTEDPWTERYRLKSHNHSIDIYASFTLKGHALRLETMGLEYMVPLVTVGEWSEILNWPIPLWRYTHVMMDF